MTLIATLILLDFGVLVMPTARGYIAEAIAYSQCTFRMSGAIVFDMATNQLPRVFQSTPARERLETPWRRETLVLSL